MLLPHWALLLAVLQHLADPLLQTRSLGFRYGARIVFSGIDLTLQAGSCTLVSGENGAGKSTLLQLLQGSLQPSTGWVRLQGRPLKGQRRRIGLVRQHPGVRWHYPIDVAGLVGMPCGHHSELTAAALELTGLRDLATAPVATLSGGQRQRALIARAVTSRAEVLLLDEPLSHLDQTHRNRLGELISELGRQGLTIVFTAHGELPGSLKPDARLELRHGGLMQRTP